MKRKDPRGNAGRGIETSNDNDSTALSSPLFACDEDARLTRTLRAYQRAAVEHVLAAYDRGERCGLISLPTGSGKTLVAGEILRQLRGRALVVAHTSLLVEQLRGTLAAYLGEHVGLVLDGAIEHETARVIVASRQSLTPARLAAIAECEPFKTLVFDEAHHAAVDSTYCAILDALRVRAPDLFVFGLTATPWRESGRMIFDSWWFSREIADLIPLGVLAPVRCSTVELPLDLRHVRVCSRGSRDFSSQALEPGLLAVVEETAARVAPLLRSLRHIVVFAATVKHAHALAAAFESAGVSAACVWGAMNGTDRDVVLQRWREGVVCALVNVGVVTEGFDEPRISAIVFARPTASTLFYVQALGRGLRTAPEKTECLVVDCVGLSDLRDARQCTLDAIVPEVAALGVYEPSKSPKGRKFMRAPGDDVGRIWHKLAENLYALVVDTREWVFVKRNASDGLYRATLLLRGECRQELEPAPFPALVLALRDRLRGKSLIFGKRNAKWRRLPATGAQHRKLARMSPSLSAMALSVRWSRGQVADAITAAVACRLARALGLLATEAA